ncbi:MAG: YciI family protein [Balneolaceae bacterium]|jgi:uncharacterized protein YciI
MKKISLFFIGLFWASALFAQQIDSTSAQQPETFNMQWGDSTYVMQKYFVVFLTAGPNRSQSEEEKAEIQKQHLAHLNNLYEMKKTSITGPFDDNDDILGMVIFNTATKEEAKKLAEQDPAVKAGRLLVEVHPFWSAKGMTLR